eukprot:13872314-Ditylum_brightwellii.AAC.1
MEPNEMRSTRSATSSCGTSQSPPPLGPIMSFVLATSLVHTPNNAIRVLLTQNGALCPLQPDSISPS